MSSTPQQGLDETSDAHRARQLALLVESVTEYAIFALDPQGNIVTWNRGAQRLKGYREHEIVGKHFSTFYTQIDRARNHPAHELEVAAREGRYMEEGWRVRKDGTTFWASVTITALRDRTGELVGFGKVTRDMTDRREAEQDMIAAAREIEQANADLRTFASAAAHDLTEPLRTVRGFADLLAARHAEQLDQRGRDYLEYVRSGAARMQTLIEHLLAYARAGAHGRPLVPVDSGETLRRVLAGLEAAIRDGGAEVEVDYASMPTVSADGAGLELVLQNLVSNALKFAGDGTPHVRVSVSPDPAGWRFEVADNGIGIPEDLQQDVFDPFRRVHGRDEIKGTGLGLAICQRIVASFGGTIGVESEPGKGSTFHFTVPGVAEGEA